MLFRSDPWGNEYQYACVEPYAYYRLWSTGPDGISGTPDDVVADTDSDGLPDDWEVFYFGNLSRNGSGNYDGDPMTDFEEYVADTDPTNKDSYLAFTTISTVSGSVRLNWAGGSQATQYVEWCAGLLDPVVWTPVFTNPPPTPTNGTLDAAGPGVKPVLLSVDGASVQYRRVLERLQKQEQVPTQPA